MKLIAIVFRIWFLKADRMRLKLVLWLLRKLAGLGNDQTG